MVFYRVTLCGTVYDRALVGEKCFECTFITRGMDDSLRMRRAIYFFEVALFNKGLLRHKLLTQSYDETKRVTHIMYSSMIGTYKMFSSFLERINSEMAIFVVALDRLTQAPIVHTCTPFIRRLYIKPEMIDFNMSWCHKCLRIVEGVKEDPYTCSFCSRLPD